MNGLKKRIFTGRSRWLLCVAAGLLALFFAGCSGLTEEEYMFGKDFKAEQVTEFYYTVTDTSYPPKYERRHFFKRDGGYYYFHEKMEGSLPAYSEALAVIDTGDERVRPITEEQWLQLTEILLGGKVTKRSEDITEGGGSRPAVFLYWTNDKGKYQVYSFKTAQAETDFLSFSAGLE